MENIKTSLSSQGYSIYKNKISTIELKSIQEDLSITPFVCPGYGTDEDITPYKIYKENTEKIYVPFHYGFSKYGTPEKIKLAEPDTIAIAFSADRKMRPYQDEIISTYINSAKKKGGGIISVGCGRGKTVMGLKIIELLKVKTLILVHKEFLMNQWVERIKEYLPTARIGYIQGKTLDIQRKDIVLAMIQSLSDPRKDKDYPINIFETFGLVIADECHHLAARQFVRSLGKYSFKYTLGLSATPNRADNLQRVFKYYLGEIVYKDAEIQKTEEDLQLEHIPNSTVEVYIYHNNNPKYCKEEMNYKKKPNVVIMKSNIAECIKRTTFLLSFLPRLISEGRYILLLSCRREHIFQMEKMINDMAIPECTVGLYLGGMKQEDLDISATRRVIIATFNMAEEAFDCKSLNTLIYMTPHNNIEQAVGRILREEKKKRTLIPLIIDLQDTFSSFNKWNKLREKYYKSKGYPIKIFNVNDNMQKNNPECPPEVVFIKDISANYKTSRNANKKVSGKLKKNKDTEVNSVDSNDSQEEEQQIDIDF
jgi:superfamily II DNA or RNA helicase